MDYIRAAVRVIPATQDEDRAVYSSGEDWALVVLADGAGGISGGRRAAEIVANARFTIATPEDAIQELRRLDALIADDSSAGETTAVLLAARDSTVFGASVGDSGAWLLGRGVTDLTASQRRKPLLGSAVALPTPFGPVPFTGRVVVASDGLLSTGGLAGRQVQCI